MVYGRPISIEKPTANPSEEELLRIYGCYCQELQRMFSVHAPKCLPQSVAQRGLKTIRIGVDKDPYVEGASATALLQLLQQMLLPNKTIAILHSLDGSSILRN